MRIETIETTARFDKHYKKLPKRINELAKEKEFIFRENPFDARLDTHKLHGKEKDTWAFSIIRAYRIKFIFLNGSHVLFLDVGTHEIYK